MLKYEIAKWKLHIGTLLLVYVAILIALGSLGVASRANPAFSNKIHVQTTTSSDVKIDGLPTSPERPAAEPRPMEPHARVVSVWYRTAGLASRNQKDLAVEIIEAEIRSAQYEVLLEAAKLVLIDAEPVEIARK